MRFDERFLDEIKSRLRLSDVIGRSVKLRRQGRASRLLKALFAQYPDKKWVVSAIYPEEIGGELLATFGFERQALTQWQMRLLLG